MPLLIYQGQILSTLNQVVQLVSNGCLEPIKNTAMQLTSVRSMEQCDFITSAMGRGWKHGLNNHSTRNCKSTLNADVTALLRNTIMYASFSRLTEVTDNVLSVASLTVANIHGYACNLPAVPNDATISIPTYALPPELVKCLVARTQLSKLLFVI